MQHIRRLPKNIRPAYSIYLPLLFSIFLTGTTHAAEVFTWKDSAGKIHFGDKPASGVQATRMEVQTAPAGQASSPQTSSVHDGGYSDTLNTCLQAGGTQTDCVAKATAAQTDKAMYERARAEAQRANEESNQESAPIYQPSGNSDAETAQRAAALAARRARLEREQRDRDWRMR